MGLTCKPLAKHILLAITAAGFFVVALPVHAQRAAPQEDPLQANPDDVTPPSRRSQPLPPSLRGSVGNQTPADPNAPANDHDASALANPTDPSQVRPAPPRQPRTSAQTQATIQSPLLRPVVPPTLNPPVLDPRAATSGGALVTPPAPPQPPPLPDPNPYAPTGITIGSFTLRPAVETGIGFTNNANGTIAGQTRTAFARNAAEATLSSNWSNHALGLRLRYEREDFFTSAVDARNTLDVQATGRLDVTRNTQIDVGAGFRRAPDSAYTFNLPVTATGRPDLDTTTANVALTQRFGRVTLRLRGQFDALRYGNTRLLGGGSVSGASRNLDVTTVTLRSGYDITPAITPFAEIAYNRRDYQQAIDPFGLRQGSDGITPRGGLALNFGPALTGEIAAGYLVQRQREPTIPRVEGFTVDGTLAYQLSGLTTLRFQGRSGVLDSQQAPGSTGGFTRDLFFTLEHAFRRNLIATATLNLGLDQFAGITRTDKRLLALLALTYRLNRNVSLTTRYVYSRVDSTIPGIAQSASSIEGGLRIEY